MADNLNHLNVIAAFPALSDSESDEDVLEDQVLNIMESSSSDSGNDSDDGEGVVDVDNNDQLLPHLLNLLMYGRRRAKVDDYLAVVRQKSNEDFRKDYRLRREVAYDLIDRLHESGRLPDHESGRPKATAELSFLLFVWYVANDEPLRTHADRFDLSESSVFRIIRRVAEWLVTLVPEYIRWPRGNEVRQTHLQFGDMTKCIGAVDGSFIPIYKPMENARDYYCRKGFYAINLTAICNADRKFTMIYVGEPGSLHDVTVFRNSPFHAAVEADVEAAFPDSTYIIGDGAYQGINPSWIVIPFRNNGALTPRQIEFNYRLSSRRVCIEHAFGILKGRFRRLSKRVHLFEHAFLVDVIMGCCVLHNICLDGGDDGEEYMLPPEDEDEDVENDAQRQLNNNFINARGRRAFLFREMFGEVVQ